MEESASSSILDGDIVGVRFALATRKEICTSSISDCPISHSSQLSNPFLGLPLECGKCESCGTSEVGKCEGHFGYIELPIPIYHPSHVSELKRLLSILCLKCLKIRNHKMKNNSITGKLLSSCCDDSPQVSIQEVKMEDSPSHLELKLPSKSRVREGFWNFLEKYGFRYGDNVTRTLLPCEVMEILKNLRPETRKKLSGKGFFPQEGYIMQYLPVPPNCLSLPDVSDGVTIMCSDLSTSMIKKVMKQIEIIKSSRSGTPNFESHEVEAKDLQLAVYNYLQVRGIVKASRDSNARFGVKKESDNSLSKAWLDKMRALFISKSSGFSSRSVITGDSYKRVNEIGIPSEIAQRMTFEERVTGHNIKYLQQLVDDKLCLTFRDGPSTYSLREGSKGHTFLRPGQVVHRRIVDGDMVFINRPPTTHKHCLQALKVYVHEDHTVKINPLICGPLGADFDGDCIHIFYPQSLAAKAEVLELFSVDKQLLSSHNGSINLELSKDSLLSLKLMFKTYVFNKASAQQLFMFVSNPLPQPALLKGNFTGPRWTALQILQSTMSPGLHSNGERYLINGGELLKADLSRGVVQFLTEFVTSIFSQQGPEAVLNFFNSLQPLLMENLYAEGFSISLEDLWIPKTTMEDIRKKMKKISHLLYHLRLRYNELLELQVGNVVRAAKEPAAKFIAESSVLGNLIDPKSDSAVNKVVQQIGFLGQQLSDRGKLYSKTLVEDMASHFERKYPSDGDDFPCAKYGLVKSCFFRGLDPFEAMVHSISTREVIVRSTRGLSEPGTLFKNLMSILRDVAVCYDGTVRNVSSNSIIQFEYGVKPVAKSCSLFPAGEPVGVLAATAMSNPAYKAVLDSTASSNSSWELMKEILLSRAGFKNDVIDRRVILYLNDCCCGNKCCGEKAVCVVKNHLKKVSLKDVAVDFSIEYRRQRNLSESVDVDVDAGLVGHIHLNETLLKEMNINMSEILLKCQENVNLHGKKKKGVGRLFKSTIFTVSDCCSFQKCCADEFFGTPCLMFFSRDLIDNQLERTSYILADVIYPVLSETIIKGDPRIHSANIIWVSPDTTTWIRSPSGTQEGAWALDIVLEKSSVKESGDTWRIVLDACLPVFHLIDTTRSIPYAIKQVHELLGVSCAFDQAIQRLSTSVNMVAKGVLKEHLLLLANSMTCSGNLVGFNVGGYKALSNALNFQAPFADATLFTPKRCFERAAEKCHVDTLNNIVASCAWGKHVTVGTGSRFDIIWNTGKDVLDPIESVDVYDVLSMLRGTPNADEPLNTCIGVEVDDLMIGDEANEWAPSPEHESGQDKPTFDDIIELELVDSAKPDPWGNSSGAWDSTVSKTDDACWGTKTDKNSISNDCIGWGKGPEKENGAAQNTGEEDSVWGKMTHDSTTKSGKEPAWGNPQSQDSASTDLTGGNKNGGTQNTGEEDAVWGKKAQDSTSKSGKEAAWGNPQSQYSTSTDWTGGNKGWGTQNHQNIGEEDAVWGKKAQDSTSKSRKETAWGNQQSQDSTSTDWTGGNKDRGTQKQNAFSQNIGDETGWGVKKYQDSASRDWASGQKLAAAEKQKAASQETGVEAGWGADVGRDSTSGVWTSWNKERAETQTPNSQKTEAAVGWENQVGQDTTPNDWTNSEKQKSPSPGDWTMNGGNPVKASEWNNKIDQSQSPSPWTSSEDDWSNKNPVVDQKREWGSGGNNWKNKNRPPNMPRIPREEFIKNFTATRQRLDMFTSDEQTILSDIEPLMLSIRRIIHQSGYNDGDPISADDQSYVLEKVFEHHPDKAAKIGSGIDHVTVCKHINFPENRCFYIASADGEKRDFSYRKCLDNLIRGKYPELAEEFLGKYFRKRQQQNVPKETGDGELKKVEEAN